MLCDVTRWADTSSNQASKDPSQLRCGSSNLGKFINLWLRRLWLRVACWKIPFPDILRPKQKWQPATITSGSSLPACHF
jgi:hypothetical protein